MTTPTRRLTRADYDTHKAEFIAKLKLEMEAQNLSPASLAAKSRQRALNLETDTSVSEVNVYHYRGGIAMPTPKKLVELATCLGLRPDELMPKALMGQRRYVSRRVAVSQTQNYNPLAGSSLRPFTINVLPAPEPEMLRLVVDAVLPAALAHALATKLRTRCEILKLASDSNMSEEEAEATIKAATERWKVAHPGQ